MARRVEDDDESGDNEDWEGDFDDLPDEDNDSTIPCPYCDRPIHEESERCPFCERYISEEDDDEVVPARKPWWIIIGAMIALYVVYRWIFG
jgi:hypothetical protein